MGAPYHEAMIIGKRNAGTARAVQPVTLLSPACRDGRAATGTG
jgi:hypothetical protein